MHFIYDTNNNYVCKFLFTVYIGWFQYNICWMFLWLIIDLDQFYKHVHYVTVIILTDHFTCFVYNKNKPIIKGTKINAKTDCTILCDAIVNMEDKQ